MENLCDSCSNYYREYGQMLCKYEGDDLCPPELYEEDVTECKLYSKEEDYPYEEFWSTDDTREGF